MIVDRPDIRNAAFGAKEDIIISRAAAGGFLVVVGGGRSEPWNMNQLYAACSTADETVELVRDMLKAPGFEPGGIIVTKEPR